MHDDRRAGTRVVNTGGNIPFTGRTQGISRGDRSTCLAYGHAPATVGGLQADAVGGAGEVELRSLDCAQAVTGGSRIEVGGVIELTIAVDICSNGCGGDGRRILGEQVRTDGLLD